MSDDFDLKRDEIIQCIESGKFDDPTYYSPRWWTRASVLYTVCTSPKYKITHVHLEKLLLLINSRHDLKLGSFDEEWFGQPMHVQVIDDGDLEKARVMKKYGCDFKMLGRMNRTALHYAQSSEAVRFLIAEGIDINHVDVRGRTAIMGFKTGTDEVDNVIIEMMYIEGVDLNHTDHGGFTLLDYQYLNHEEAELAYRCGARPSGLPPMTKWEEVMTFEGYPPEIREEYVTNRMSLIERIENEHNTIAMSLLRTNLATELIGMCLEYCCRCK